MDTAKQAKILSEEGCEEVTDICSLGDIPFVCVGNAGGQISIIAIPPLPYKYTRICIFNNVEINIPDTPQCIHSLIYCDKR